MSAQNEVRKHALLSASSAHRWMHCTPSAKLEEKFQESAPSTYADEGTLAHEIGALKVNHLIGTIRGKAYEAEYAKLKKNCLFSEEMDEVIDGYAEFVLAEFRAAKVAVGDPILFIEEKLDFSHFVEKGFGTGDSGIIADHRLTLIDLKYGKGVKVDAKDNVQLMLYGLGAIDKYEMLYNFDTIRFIIYQPRIDHVSAWDIPVKDLMHWAENELRPTAAIAYAGEGEQQAGEWCKFCKVKAMCKALAEANMKLAQHEFRDPNLLTQEEILGIYKQQPMLVDWAEAVAQYMLSEALAGKQWPGYKLVEGKSNRRWIDEQKVVEALIEAKFTADKFMVSKLAGIPTIEKLVGKTGPALEGYVTKPQGAPTLVPESDKRQSLKAEAKDDFK